MPDDGASGAWVDARVHACRAGDLPAWLDDELWKVELEPPVEEAEKLLTARRGRLLERVGAWDAAAARDFAALCVEHARLNAVRHAGAEDAVAFFADVVELSRGGRPDAYGLALESLPASLGAIAANVGFVTAHAIAASAPEYDAAFAAERALQSAWLDARLAFAD